MRSLIPLLLAVQAAGLGCQASAEPDPTTYTVTATVGMITDIVRQVAGDRAIVQGLIGEGVDPHLYKPTRDDILKLKDADVVFYNGLMLEGKMTDVLIRVARKNPHVYAVTDLLQEEQQEYVITDQRGHYDPHVWMDVGGWQKAVTAVADALSEYDPDHAADYRSNAAAYLTQLQALDEYARRAFASIPARQRVLVTAHDAFSYLGRAYGVQVRGIQGISTESEAGVKDINDLVSFIVDNDIRAVFVETSVADKNVRALVEGAESRNHDVPIGGKLFSDAMGPPGSYEGTYVGMIDHNVTTIVRALGGDAPQRGMQGRLKIHEH